MLSDLLGQQSGVDGRTVLDATDAVDPERRIRWAVRAGEDRVEFLVPPGAVGITRRRATLACGAALCHARLAVLAHGRMPLVRYPGPGGPVAVLRVGRPAEPRPDALGLYAGIRAAPRRVAPAAAQRVAALLRRAADAERVWWRSTPDLAPAGDGGPRLGALLGAPREDRTADLRLGHAAQLMRLVARTGPGWDVDVVALVPADHPVAQRAGQTVVRIGARPWTAPTASVPPRGGTGAPDGHDLTAAVR